MDLKRIHVLNLIEKYDIPPSEVVLEITEDKFDGNIEKLLSIVNVFKDYGFKLRWMIWELGFPIWKESVIFILI